MLPQIDHCVSASSPSAASLDSSSSPYMESSAKLEGLRVRIGSARGTITRGQSPSDSVTMDLAQELCDAGAGGQVNGLTKGILCRKSVGLPSWGIQGASRQIHHVPYPLSIDCKTRPNPTYLIPCPQTLVCGKTFTAVRDRERELSMAYQTSLDENQSRWWMFWRCVEQ